jgi:chorismate dehydratase
MGELTFPKSLRVGKVDFINTLPIFYPLESGAIEHDFEIVGATPAVLNALLASGKIDLGVISSIEYGRNFNNYLLLPGLSISCQRRVCSVLLLSTLPLQQLHEQEILLTPKSHTSIALLKLLFARKFAITPHYRVTDYHGDDLTWPAGAKAVLAIGDDALRLQKSPAVALTLDLGAAWHEWTGHPFVFAVWALRHQSLAKRDGQLHQAHATLVEARNYGLNHLEEIATAVGQRSWFSRQECLQYLQTIKYDLDGAKQAGLQLFFDMLYEAGELSRPVPLNFLTSVCGKTGL